MDLKPLNESIQKATTKPNDPPTSNSVLSDLSGQWNKVAEWNQNVSTLPLPVKVVGALVLFFVAWVLAGRVSRLAYRSLQKAKIDETLARFLTKFTWWSVLVFAVITSLGWFGVNTTSFAAAIGAVGFAIGLAFQGALGNFAAGIMLLIFRPYKVGDVIVVGSHTGKVDEIDLFSTTLDTADNRRIIVPNGSIFGNTIENTSYHRNRRAEITVGVGYAASIDQTYEVLMHAVCSVSGILSDPAPEVVLLELATSSVNWSVRAWSAAADHGLIKQRTIRAVKLALDQAGIEMPFPQMDVNLRPGPNITVSSLKAA